MPDDLKNNDNVTFHVQLERAPISTDSKQEVLKVNGKMVGAQQTFASYNQISPYIPFMIEYTMGAFGKDYGDTQMMPGFRVKWWYSGVNAAAIQNRMNGKYLNDRMTKNLRR